MIGRDNERMLTTLLRDAAPPAPGDLGAQIASAVSATPQRRRWSARLHTGGVVAAPRLSLPAVPLAAAVGALLVALLAIAVVGALVRNGPVRNGPFVHTLQEPNFGAFTIYVRDPDGSNPRTIGHGDCPTFVEGGRLIWTGDSVDTSRTVFIAGRDGSDPRPLRHLAGAVDIAVAPDGRRVAWLRKVGDYMQEPEEVSVEIVELWISDLEGGPGRRLSVGAPGTVSPYFEPTWSPDGRSIAFGTTDDPRKIGSAFTPRTSVRVIDADGSNERTVSDRRGHLFGRAAWSSDGRYLAYGGELDDSRPHLEGADEADLFVADFRIGVETNVTMQGEPVERPAWSPDGRALAFVGPEGDLRVLDMDGATPLGEPRSASAEWPVNDVGWSPDGEWIVRVVRDRTQEHGSLGFVHPSLRGPDRTVAEGVVTCLPSWEDGTP